MKCNNFFKILIIVGQLFWGCAQGQELRLTVQPGEIYTLPEGEQELRIFIRGADIRGAYFTIRGNKTVLTGNSFIKLESGASDVKIVGVTFKDADIKFGNSNGLISVGETKKDKIQNVFIDSVAFSNTRVQNKEMHQFYWIGIAASDVVIQNCLFERKNNRLPIISIASGFQNIQVKDNVFRDVKPLSNNGLEAIRVGLQEGTQEGKGVVIVNNIFDNYFGDSETISVKANNVLLYGNTFKNSRSGISLRYSNGSVISNNNFTNVRNPLRIAGANHRVEANSFETSNENRSILLMMGGRSYERVHNIEIRNNKFSKLPEIITIQSPDHTEYPTDIHFDSNSVGKSVLPNKVINFARLNKKKYIDRVWKDYDRTLTSYKYLKLN